LLHELIERLDWKLLPRENGALAADFVLGPEAEQLPRLLLGAEERLGVVNFRVARPRGPATLDCIGDVGVIAGVEEELLPSRLAVQLGFPSDACEPATMP
jgi:hypothetical protein